MKIIIGCDSFKGSLSSGEVAEAAARGILSVISDCHIRKIFVGDGGEGTTVALVSSLGGRIISCAATDPLGREIYARYGIMEVAGEKLAVIESAAASGITLIDPIERDALKASSFGTGQLILDAIKRGCRNFIIGLGGSATTDGGVGMLSAFGVRFLDDQGEVLPPDGASLEKLARIDTQGLLKELRDCNFKVLCDVKNPLYGSQGAAYVFGPQKGASPTECDTLDRGLRNLSVRTLECTGKDISNLSGAGAAGGIGAAFCAYLNVELCPGVDTLLDIMDFNRIISDADLIITGEGCLDSQTLYGKLPMGILRCGQEAGIPVVAIGGCVKNPADLLKVGFAGVFPIIHQPLSLKEAMQPNIANENVSATCGSIAAFMSLIKNGGGVVPLPNPIK